MTPKWIQKLIDKGVSPEVIQARVEKRRAKDREWARLNKDRKAANKRSYVMRRKSKQDTTVKTYEGAIIKCTYRANWKEAPVYYCPELTYRGQTND